MKKIFTLGAALLGAVILSGCGYQQTSQNNAAAPVAEAGTLDLTNQSEVVMDISGFAFSKPNIKIKKGTKVTWTNQDAMQHNVMREHADSDQPHLAPTKEQVTPDVFAGPLLNKGESYSFVFTTIGSNSYHCALHPYMKGLVTVVE